MIISAAYNLTKYVVSDCLIRHDTCSVSTSARTAFSIFSLEWSNRSGIQSLRETTLPKTLFNQDDFKRWAMRELLHQYNDFYFTSEISHPPHACSINSRHSSPVFSNSCFVSVSTLYHDHADDQFPVHAICRLAEVGLKDR